MANIKSAIKRAEIAQVKTARNNAIKSSVKTAVKKSLNASTEDSQVTLKEAVKLIDKAVAKGVMHKNTAARKKSRLAKIVNQK